MEGLIEGRIVHYVAPNGQHRPAIVVNVLDQNGVISLQSFHDYNGLEYVSGVEHSAEPVPGSWHWIEEAQPVPVVTEVEQSITNVPPTEPPVEQTAQQLT